MPADEDLRVCRSPGPAVERLQLDDGGYRSRVDFDLDLPIRLPTFIGTVAHETYPGHHLEHARKEQVLVEELGHPEASVLVINAPECPSEGPRISAGSSSCRPRTRAGLLAELAGVAGLVLADDPGALDEAAARQAQIAALARCSTRPG